MSELSALTAGAAGADFHVLISFGRWVFGFVAYRDHTQVLLGEEARWYALPSWLTAFLFIALAVAEWLVLRFLGKLLGKWRAAHQHKP